MTKINIKCLPRLITCLCACLVALLYGLVHAIKAYNGQWDSTLAFFLLAFAVAYFGFVEITNSDSQTTPTAATRVLAWCLVVAAVILPFVCASLSTEAPVHVATLLLCIATLLFFHGWPVTSRLAGAFFLLCFCVPLREQIFLLVAYPLRLISTVLSCELLKLFGVNITYQLTTIRLAGSDIVITDACSGIQQLESLLLVAYLIVKFQHKPLFWSVCHFLFLLPIVILANSGRIIVTILLYNVIGPMVLNNTWHTVLGYAMVIVSAFLLWEVGALFSPESAPASNQQDAT